MKKLINYVGSFVIAANLLFLSFGMNIAEAQEIEGSGKCDYTTNFFFGYKTLLIDNCTDPDGRVCGAFQMCAPQTGQVCVANQCVVIIGQ